MIKKNYIIIILVIIGLLIGLTACDNIDNTDKGDISTEGNEDSTYQEDASDKDEEENLFVYETDDQHNLLKGFFLAYYNGVLEDEKYNVYYEKNEDTYLIIKLSGYEYSLNKERMDVQYADVDITISESEKETDNTFKLKVFVSVEGIRGFGGSEFYMLLEQENDLYKVISIDENSATYETLKGNVTSYMEEHGVSYYESVDNWTRTEKQY